MFGVVCMLVRNYVRYFTSRGSRLAVRDNINLKEPREKVKFRNLFIKVHD